MTLEPITYLDVPVIKKILIKNTHLTDNKLLLTELFKHLNNKNGFSFKAVIDDKIVAIWFSMEFDTYTSLSYFYTEPSIRCKPEVFKIFKLGLSKCNSSKPLYIKSKNTTGFSKYVKHIKDDIYQFIGLR